MVNIIIFSTAEFKVSDNAMAVCFKKRWISAEASFSWIRAICLFVENDITLSVLNSFFNYLLDLAQPFKYFFSNCR